MTAASRGLADATTADIKSDKTFTGDVRAVDSKAGTVKVQGWWIEPKIFNLGTACSYSFLDTPSGAVVDLHPGQKVKVSYRNASGVLVADRVEQEPMSCVGTVESIDPARHTIMVHERSGSRSFQIADDCRVVLRNDKSGTLADLRPGHYITVIYELPNSAATARSIAQTSESFTGTLTAIDLDQRTIRAKAAFGSRDFHLGNDCKIVIDGKTDAEMRSLKPGDKLTFNYDDVNGINVANRVGNDVPASDAMAQTGR